MIQLEVTGTVALLITAIGFPGIGFSVALVASFYVCHLRIFNKAVWSYDQFFDLWCG